MILQMKINNNRLERMLLRQEVFTNCKQKSENLGCTNMMKTISIEFIEKEYRGST
jgi:hypothetical protein